jgi:hypothetical protein
MVNIPPSFDSNSVKSASVSRSAKVMGTNFPVCPKTSSVAPWLQSGWPPRRLLQQRLPVSPQHRYETDTYPVANNLNQLFTPAGTPVGVNDIAARDLQTAAGTLKTPVSVNLIKHLS